MQLRPSQASKGNRTTGGEGSKQGWLKAYACSNGSQGTK